MTGTRACVDLGYVFDIFYLAACLMALSTEYGVLCTKYNLMINAKNVGIRDSFQRDSVGENHDLTSFFAGWPSELNDSAYHNDKTRFGPLLQPVRIPSYIHPQTSLISV